MSIDQKTINDLFTGITTVMDGINEVILQNIDRLEASGDKEDFKKAQALKIKFNEIGILTNQSKSEYPHLFK